MMLLFLCGFLSVLVLPCHGAIARLEPLSYVALLNQANKPTFSCTVDGANYASWEINNEPDLVHKESERQRRGIETEHERIAGMQRSYYATLKLSPSEINQYTEIKCWAAVRDGMGISVASKTAIFQVQGVLGEPQNVTSIHLNLTHTRINWLPPYTLNITDIEPDIQQYTVCVSIADISHYCFNSTARELILPNLNVHKEVNVSAWNGLGEGETAELSVDACEPQDTESAEAVVEVGEFAEINLVITFRHKNLSAIGFNSICFCLYNLTLALNDSVTHLGHLIPTLFQSESYSILVPANLLPNEQYKAELTCVTGDSLTTPNTTLHFNSFDVQDVILKINEENLTILICCEFAFGSQAQGCNIYITINYTEHHQQQHITRNLTQHDATSCWEENDINPGISYTISVYDWERDGSIELRKPVYSADVFVNASDEDHNTDRSTSIPTTEAKTEPKKEAAVTVHTTSLIQVTVDKETSHSTHTILFIIVVACGSAALFLFIILVVLTVCCCVLVKRKRGVVYSISAPREFIYRSSCSNNLEEDGEIHQMDSFSQTHSIELNSYYDNSRDAVLSTDATTLRERSTHTHSTCVNMSSVDYKKLHTNDITNALTLSQCVPDTYHPVHHTSQYDPFTQVDTSCSNVDNTSPVVHCPVYDHTKMPVYDQIVQPCPRFSQLSSNETFTINNDSYSSVADSMMLETNASYVCPQKQNRKFKVNRGPLPPLPLETNSTSHRGMDAATVYETVSDA